MIHSKNLLRSGTLVGSFKMDVGTVYSQPGEYLCPQLSKCGTCHPPRPGSPWAESGQDHKLRVRPLGAWRDGVPSLHMDVGATCVWAAGFAGALQGKCITPLLT